MALVVVALVVVVLVVVALVVVVPLLVEDAGSGVDIMLVLTAGNVNGVLVSEIVLPCFVVDVVAVIVLVDGALMVVVEEVESSEGSVERISPSKTSIVISGKGGAVSSLLMDTC